MKFRLLPDNPHVGKAPYFFLLYLVFLFIAPRTQFDWAITIGSLVIFLPMYFRDFWVQGREAVVLTCSIALLGFLLYPLNPGATVYIIFASAAVAYAARPARAAVGIITLVVLLVLETLYFRAAAWGWLPALICLAVGFSNIHFAENMRHHHAMRRAEEQMQEMAKVAETCTICSATRCPSSS
jgi:two-component system sensor histidine kinase DesK